MSRAQSSPVAVDLDPTATGDTTRKQAIERAGALAAEHEYAIAQMTPREQAEAAWTPTSSKSVDELEAEIRRQRGLPLTRAS